MMMRMRYDVHSGRVVTGRRGVGDLYLHCVWCLCSIAAAVIYFIIPGRCYCNRGDRMIAGD